MEARYALNIEKGHRMCISFGLAEFSQTLIFAGVKGPQHLLVYQNRVSNLASPVSPMLSVGGLVDAWNAPESPVRPGNAMIWPVPSLEPLTGTSLFSLSKAPRLLMEMWSRIDNGGAVMRGWEPVAKTMGIEVAEVGIYTVVIANSASAEAVHEVLETKVPQEKRPEMNLDLLEWFARSYPNWPLVIACFAQADAQLAEPFGVSYTPLRKDLLYLPGADAHDGRPPRIGQPVATDHILLLGADRINGGHNLEPVMRSAGSKLGDIAFRFPDMYAGVKSDKSLPNGDWVIPVSDLIAGRLDALRRSAPPASA